MVENLYELIGGCITIEAATELFYNKVLQDDSLRRFFDRVDMAHLRSRQAMFISMLLAVSFVEDWLDNPKWLRRRGRFHGLRLPFRVDRA